MTGFQLLMLYFSTAVSALCLAAGGYKIIRAFIISRFESAVSAEAASRNSAE